MFRCFDVLGGFEAIGDFAANSKWRRVPTNEGGARTMELPTASVVVMFPAE